LPAFEEVVAKMEEFKINPAKTIIYLITDACAHFHDIHCLDTQGNSCRKMLKVVKEENRKQQC
jgi:hypothetical protein